MTASVLVVEDDEAMGRLVVKQLEPSGYHATATRSAIAALALLEEREFDAVLTDINMPQMNGLEFCERLQSIRPEIPVVVMTAFGSMETAISAIRAGAYDFIPKPMSESTLLLTIDRAVKHRALHREVVRLRSEVASTRHDGEFVGESEPFRKMLSLIGRMSESDAPALITGETGSGKEQVARRIHQTSRRRNGAFVAINCAAMPEALLESELFGHAKGAFTDAKTSRTGLFVQASGGSLFLDEVGELPLSLQPKLLRALQEKKVRPIGSNTEVPFDARILAATNRALEDEIEAGRFREDLFFRLNVIALDLPPLRARGNDVLLLADQFLKVHAEKSGKPKLGLSVAAAKCLTAYAWPGNVRELQNCIERAVTFASDIEIRVEDLPEKIGTYHPVYKTLNNSDIVTLKENELRYVARVVEATNGNKSEAARLLGIDRKSLWRRLARPDEPGEPEYEP